MQTWLRIKWLSFDFKSAVFNAKFLTKTTNTSAMMDNNWCTIKAIPDF